MENDHLTHRANYVPQKQYAYEDSPQSIGYSATISAPHMHANATESLLPFLKPGAKVLDVGCGSGYLLGIFHELVSPAGKVVGIEHVKELSDISRNNLQKDGKLQDSVTLKVVTGDGRQGYLPDAHVFKLMMLYMAMGAAAPKMPQALIDQLASPGRMFIPVGSWSQDIIQVDKDENGSVTQKSLYGVRYVPLTDLKAQLAAND